MSLKMNWVLPGALILKEVQEVLPVTGRQQQMIKLLQLLGSWFECING